jgi:hypothetical protein
MTIRWSPLVAVLLACTARSNDVGDRSAQSDVDRAPSEVDAPARIGGESQQTTPDATPLGTCAGPPGRTIRTLIVGNSQIYFWNLPKLLSQLSETGPAACPRIAAEGFTRGGQNLQRLWQGGDSLGKNLEATIHDGKYDVVVISECIDLIELPPPRAQFVTYANLIIDAARASGAVPVLYATPYVDQDGHKNFVEMAEPQLALGLERSVSVAAGGLAWLRVWKELPELDLHHADHAHPGYKGSLISAMVLYSVITRAAPLGLDPTRGVECEPRPGQYEPCPAITKAEADVFQTAAWAEAVATGMN